MTTSEDLMRYDQLVEEAMRGVVRAALERAAEEGLPGEHHFYITFRTGQDEVEIPGWLRERYPDEMTIVLQHRFSDLEVDEQGFGVTLSFNEIPARLQVPYVAIAAFADPSVRFGFTFASGQQLTDLESEGEAAEAPEAEAQRPSSDGLPHGEAPNDMSADDLSGGNVSDEAKADDAPATGDQTVVSLDRFRKSKS
ncbi:SspB family protein [Algihabitans albus]|uniref:SspB family protein n=1 Tax=Algihabitans albus TaxID=2164067 RepID=UPI000E5D4C39|nr:ClpXP protease specificity-enhancing factor SspB [Algihabitans albus]